jgi:hypothetical protein
VGQHPHYNRQGGGAGGAADFLEEHGSEVMNMLLEEWNLDEAKEVWLEEGWEKAEAKYQPIIAEKDQRIEETQMIIEDLKRKLREAGIDPR